MDVRIFRLLLFPLLMVFVAGQIGPTNYPFDCRRTNVDCNGGQCSSTNGSCTCSPPSSEYNCALDTSDVAESCTADQCQYNAVCLSNGGCFCNSNTYGTKCENPRLKMWCDNTAMFINIYPHGDAQFNGIIFVSRPPVTGTPAARDADACRLQPVSGASLDLSTTYPYVTTVQGTAPTLEGYYIVLPHEPESGTTSCTAARKFDSANRTDYIQDVVLEYNKEIISSYDQVVNFNCSISKTADIVSFTSSNAMSVTIFDNDYQKVNVTESLEPILFEIRNANTGSVITNDVNLGDPLNLQFTLQTSGSSDPTSPVQFKVTQCTATNSQPVQTDGGTQPPSIEFLVNDCPGNTSSLLYRGNVVQDQTTDGKEQTTIPLNAFRFVGSYDSVAFTCQVKLCTSEQIATDPDLCKKAECPGEGTDTSGTSDTSGTDTSGTGTDTSGTGTDTSGTGTDTSGTGTDTSGTGTDTSGTGTDTSGTGTDTSGTGTDTSGTGTDTSGTGTDTSGTGTDTSGTGTDTSGTGRRRKREASNDQREVTQTIKVTSGLEQGQQGGSTGEATGSKEEDCMEQTDIFVILIIFAVVLSVMLVIVVLLVLKLLRSRKKVVDTSNMSMADTQSRYSLPRLSLDPSM